MSGADDRPGTLPPELLRSLREADAWLASRPPGRALEQRILAADPAPRGAWLLWFAQIAVPVALLILYMFERARPEPTRASPSEAARVLQLGRGDTGVIHRTPDAADPEPPPIVEPTDPEYEDVDDPETTPPTIQTIEAAPTPSTSVNDEPALTAPEPAATPTPHRSGPWVVPTLAPDQTASPIATPQVGPSTSGGGTAAPPRSGGSDVTPAHARPTPRPSPKPEVPRGPEMPFPVCGDVELHVVGLIDAYDSATGEEGVAHVHIDRPGTVRLFLSAYSAVTWNITVGPQTELVDVIVHGYEVQTVIAPDAELPTGTFSFEGDGLFLGCGFEYPDTDEFDGCETGELLQQISELLERPIASYHGCYAASEFNIAADLSSTSNCATDMGYSLTSASFCEE